MRVKIIKYLKSKKILWINIEKLGKGENEVKSFAKKLRNSRIENKMKEVRGK